MSVHCSPCFINVTEGDVVTIGQCRPLAKTVKFNVLEHMPSANKVRCLTLSINLDALYCFAVSQCQENVSDVLNHFASVLNLKLKKIKIGRMSSF